MPEQTSTGSLLPPFIELQSVDSTNNYARGLISEGLAQHGTVVFAHEQQAGKGQRGREWLSEKGSNIILTILLDPHPLRVAEQFQLSACVAMAVYDFFVKYTADQANIKWPNDLYWQDRKAGGVLIENLVGGVETHDNASLPSNTTNPVETHDNASLQSNTMNPVKTHDNASLQPSPPTWKWAIVGIGININQVVFPGGLKNPVSLKQITGKDYNPVELARELTGEVIRKFDQLVSGGFRDIYEYYNSHLYKKNQQVKLKKGNRVFEARIKSVTTSGKLVVQTGIEEEFEFGGIEWEV